MYPTSTGLWIYWQRYLNTRPEIKSKSKHLINMKAQISPCEEYKCRYDHKEAEMAYQKDINDISRFCPKITRYCILKISVKTMTQGSPRKKHLFLFFLLLLLRNAVCPEGKCKTEYHINSNLDKGNQSLSKPFIDKIFQILLNVNHNIIFKSLIKHNSLQKHHCNNSW